MQKRIALTVMVVLAMLLLLSGCGSKVVATVNGENISQQELDKELEMYKAGLESQGADFSSKEGKEILDRLRRNVLNQMIDEKLLMQEVRDKGLEPSSKDVQEEIKKLKEQFETEGEFKKFLTANGVNEPQLTDYVKVQLAIQNLMEDVTKDVTVTGKEVEEYYQENKDSFTHPEQRKVRHILIGFEGNNMGSERSQMDAKVEAIRLLEKIKQGADFAQLVKEKSEDPGSKDNGGLYTVTRESSFAPEFIEAAFSLAEGEVTPQPVKTEFGYHIIKLDEIIPSRVQPFEEVKDQIKMNLESNRKADKFAEYVDNLRDSAKIDNKLSNKDENNTKK